MCYKPSWTCPSLKSRLELVGIREARVFARETWKEDLEMGHVQLVLYYMARARQNAAGASQLCDSLPQMEISFLYLPLCPVQQ